VPHLAVHQLLLGGTQLPRAIAVARVVLRVAYGRVCIPLFSISLILLPISLSQFSLSLSLYIHNY
jgi:hypothetical protein